MGRLRPGKMGRTRRECGAGGGGEYQTIGQVRGTVSVAEALGGG